MKIIKRVSAPILMKNGRKTWRVFGSGGNALIYSNKMQGAYATFSPKYGNAEKHSHECEYMYVINAKDAFVCFGQTPEALVNRHELKAGDILRSHDGEWHSFVFSSEDGYVDFFNSFAIPMAHIITEKDL